MKYNCRVTAITLILQGGHAFACMYVHTPTIIKDWYIDLLMHLVNHLVMITMQEHGSWLCMKYISATYQVL